MRESMMAAAVRVLQLDSLKEQSQRILLYSTIHMDCYRALTLFVENTMPGALGTVLVLLSSGR